MESRRNKRRRKEKYFLNFKQQLAIASYCPEENLVIMPYCLVRAGGSNIISVNMIFSSGQSEINKKKLQIRTSHLLSSTVNAKTKLKQNCQLADKL